MHCILQPKVMLFRANVFSCVVFYMKLMSKSSSRIINTAGSREIKVCESIYVACTDCTFQPVTHEQVFLDQFFLDNGDQEIN